MTPDQRRTRLLRALREQGCIAAHRLRGVMGGVCVRTLYRDIQRLRARGYRIRSIGGRRGGFWLDADCIPLPLTLDGNQVREVVLALVRSAHQHALVQLPTVQPLLDVLLASLPRVREAALRRLTSEVPEGKSARRPASVVDNLENAMRWKTWVGVTSFLKLAKSRHEIDPLPLALTDGQWVLRGSCRNGSLAEVPLSTVWMAMAAPTARVRAAREDRRYFG